MKPGISLLIVAFTALTAPLFAQPTITTQPRFDDGTTDAHIVVGDYFYLTVAAVSTNNPDSLAYQWRRNGTDLSGGTNPYFYKDIAVVGDTGDYTVKVSDVSGSVTSLLARLTVVAPPDITQQPADKTIIAGNNWTFSVKVTGSTPLGFQWHKNGLDLVNDGHISGATTTNLTLTNVQLGDEGDYTITVTNAAGPFYDKTSTAAALTVLVPPIITEQPEGTEAVQGDDVIFSVDVDPDTTDTDQYPLTYQWWKGNTPLAGETDSILELIEVVPVNAGQYHVVVANAAGSVVSDNAALTVQVPPNITQHPQSRTVNAGNNVTFSVNVDPLSNRPLFYQWFFEDDEISGATNSSLTFFVNDTDQSGDYWVEVNNITDEPETSEPATLTVRAETTDPKVVITSPKEGAKFTNAFITMVGTASDNAKIKRVECRLEDGIVFYANGGSNWTASFTASPGTNTFRVQSVDSSENKSATVSRKVFYSVLSPFTLLTNGLGTVSPKLGGTMLEIGRNYVLTAKAGAGHVFAGWDMGVVSTNPILKFMMSPNMTLRANFITNPYAPVKGIYNGLFYQTNGVNHDTAGFFTFNLTPAAGLFTGKLLLGGKSLPFKGRVWVDGASTVRILRKGQPDLILNLLVDLTNGTDTVTGTLTGGGLNAVLDGDRQVFNTTTRPATGLAGKYTEALLRTVEDTNTTAPAGDSPGTVVISTAGLIKYAGVLPEGTRIMQGVGVSKNGDWPFYVNLYTGKGSLWGWLSFTNLGTNSIIGDVSWIKGGGVRGKYYTNGFSTVVESLGSHYTAPLRGVRVLNITNGEVVFTGGGLSGPLTNNAFLTTNNTLIAVTNNKLSLRLTLSSGLAAGTFIHPDTKKSTPITGVLLPGDNTLRGFFLSTNLTGGAILRPAP